MLTSLNTEKLAEEQKYDGAKANFVVQDEILYRNYKAEPNMDPVEQIMCTGSSNKQVH